MNDHNTTPQSREPEGDTTQRSGGPVIIPALAAFVGALIGAAVGSQMGG